MWLDSPTSVVPYKKVKVRHRQCRECVDFSRHVSRPKRPNETSLWPNPVQPECDVTKEEGNMEREIFPVTTSSWSGLNLVVTGRRLRYSLRPFGVQTSSWKDFTQASGPTSWYGDVYMDRTNIRSFYHDVCQNNGHGMNGDRYLGTTVVTTDIRWDYKGNRSWVYRRRTWSQ